jgi:hypothetical protein
MLPELGSVSAQAPGCCSLMCGLHPCCFTAAGLQQEAGGCRHTWQGSALALLCVCCVCSDALHVVVPSYVLLACTTPCLLSCTSASSSQRLMLRARRHHLCCCATNHPVSPGLGRTAPACISVCYVCMNMSFPVSLAVASYPSSLAVIAGTVAAAAV